MGGGSRRIACTGVHYMEMIPRTQPERIRFVCSVPKPSPHLIESIGVSWVYWSSLRNPSAWVHPSIMPPPPAGGATATATVLACTYTLAYPNKFHLQSDMEYLIPSLYAPSRTVKSKIKCKKIQKKSELFLWWTLINLLTTCKISGWNEIRGGLGKQKKSMVQKNYCWKHFETSILLFLPDLHECHFDLKFCMQLEHSSMFIGKNQIFLKKLLFFWFYCSCGSIWARDQKSTFAFVVSNY